MDRQNGILTLESLEITAYQLDFWEDGLIDVRLERTRTFHNASSWAIRERGMCLNKQGEWEEEPIPSSRGERFFARCRWNTAEEALAFWRQGHISRFEHYRAGVNYRP